jgi:hypothetical protein
MGESYMSHFDPPTPFHKRSTSNLFTIKANVSFTQARASDLGTLRAFTNNYSPVG